MEKDFVEVLIKERHFPAAWKAAEYLNPWDILDAKNRVMEAVVKSGDLNSFESLLPFNENKNKLVERIIIRLLEMERVSEAKNATKFFSSKEKKNMYKEILSLVKEEVRGFFI